MASKHAYKLFFFMQSTVFLALLMYYCYTPHPTMSHHCKQQAFIKAFDVVSLWRKKNARGPLSNCTFNDIMNRPGVVLLTTANLGFLDMTINMLASIKKIGICVYTVIVAEDKNVYRYLRRRTEIDPAIHVVMTDSGEVQSDLVMSTDHHRYFSLLKKRQGYILRLLDQNLEVLFTDSDTFWFQDPLPYFQGDFDMSMMDPRSPYPTRTNKSHYCAGFAYYKPTTVTLQFVKKWITFMEGKDYMDQSVMNKLLQEDQPVHVNIKPLDIKLFPPGPKFYEFLEKNASYSAVVMHAASIRGHDAKVRRFKSSNMWLVNKTSDELVALEHSLNV
ncbi:UDP-D-xylose:L-fucose alpha-1,3-D-xylosyltransferase MGP4-like isoform X1 [Patiria miniata]|uniref:Nucleotide-diphospho-sugar transferase domain-containing protein n=2 Tax=Patiria miniata TaxID=46514 RepID=A0A913YZA8_PATMI|nr:UDP-D-xylose:L-fucose alpha-1,3-D-xylosyltransferase MGP4-like isoform X1 [Patiria miniata]